MTQFPLFTKHVIEQTDFVPDLIVEILRFVVDLLRCERRAKEHLVDLLSVRCTREAVRSDRNLEDKSRTNQISEIVEFVEISRHHWFIIDAGILVFWAVDVFVNALPTGYILDVCILGIRSVSFNQRRYRAISIRIAFKTLLATARSAYFTFCT